MANRRRFLGLVLAGGVATTAMKAGAQAAKGTGQVLSESDPVAQALGYKTDATKVDKAKFPKYAAGQQCNNCQLYQGTASDPQAPCPTFGNKLVSAKGWCSAWVKKA